MAEPCNCTGACGDHWLDTQIVAAVVQGGYATKVFPDANKLLTPTQIAQVTTATAIAIVESGGYTEACHHNTNGTYDRGLFQINEIWGPLSNYSTDAHNMWNVWVKSGRSFKAWNGDLPARTLAMPRAAAAVAAYLKSIGRNFPIVPDPLAGNPLGPGLPFGGSVLSGLESLLPKIGWGALVGVAALIAIVAVGYVLYQSGK